MCGRAPGLKIRRSLGSGKVVYGLGVRNVVHIKAGPGCCKTTTGLALVKWLGEATARHNADDLGCRAFLLEVYNKARTRLTQVTIVDDPAAPGAVRPIGGFDATEVARVMGELNADLAQNYGAGAARKAAIAEVIARPDARQQCCWGSITRWLLLDNVRRSRRWESLAHDMRGLKVRCCAQPVACCARLQISRRGGGGGAAVCVGDEVSCVSGLTDPIGRWWRWTTPKAPVCICNLPPKS